MKGQASRMAHVLLPRQAYSVKQMFSFSVVLFDQINYNILTKVEKISALKLHLIFGALNPKKC